MNLGISNQNHVKVISSSINTNGLTHKGTIMLTYEDFGQPTRHLKRYLKLIETQALPKKVKGDYLEEHHIYPRCIFGDTDQLAVLNLRAHFIAHELIWRHYKEIKHPKANKLAYPLNRMKSAVKNQHSITERLRVTSRMAEIARSSMHEALIGKNNPFFGKKHSPEALAKMSAKNVGRKQTPETLEKMSEATKRFWKDEAYRATICEALRNRVITEETREKISKVHKGKILSDETKQKLSIAHKGIRLGWKDSKETLEKKSKSQKGKKKSEEHINKINRNPEKIRKTAEKHRGMKRSAETCRKISEKAKGRISKIKGLRTFYHPLTLEIIKIIGDKEIPEGFIKGNPLLRNNDKVKGKECWFNPSTRELKLFFKDEVKPDGWERGRPKKVK